MKLRFVLVGLLCGWLSVSGSAETPLLTLPTLVLPPGATLLRAGSWGQGAKPSFPYRPTPVDPEKQYSVGQTTRFGAAGEVSLTAANYGTQLAGLGWKKTFDGSHSSMVIHRYLVASPVAPHLGSLLVLSLKQESQFVAIRLVRSGLPWQFQPGSRSGGGGAGADSGSLALPLPLRLRLPTPRFPMSVRRLELLGGGTGSDASYQDARLETLDSPAALMKTLEPQFAKEGWVADIRGGDAVQAYASFVSPSGVDHVACLILTSIPGLNAIDVSFWAIRNK